MSPGAGLVSFVGHLLAWASGLSSAVFLSILSKRKEQIQGFLRDRFGDL